MEVLCRREASNYAFDRISLQKQTDSKVILVCLKSQI